MTYNEENEKSQSLQRRQTDPAWLQDHFLETGHTEATSSATFTFIKRKERVYAVTCGHVLDALADEQSMPKARNPTLALHLNRGPLNLSYFVAQGQIAHAISAPELEGSRREVDVAIALLSESYWSLLTTRKNKVAINLDSWREPAWEMVKYCVAVGYPGELKFNSREDDQDMVAAPFLRAIAKVASPLDGKQSIITL